MKIVLTIAGSDPSGGAGIQADLKVFSALGIYGVSVITAQTVQNSQGVKEVFSIPGDLLFRELNALIEDFPIDALKIGMLFTKENVEKVADSLRLFSTKEIVLDPVLLSSNGFPLLKDDAIPLLKEMLLPRVKLVTPNIYEAEVLAGIEIKDTEGMQRAAKVLNTLGIKNVLVKGGHLKNGATDIFYDGETFTYVEGQRMEKGTIHGTGCILSAAITVGLAEGLSALDAIKNAKTFLNNKIKEAKRVGKGSLFLV